VIDIHVIKSILRFALFCAGMVGLTVAASASSSSNFSASSDRSLNYGFCELIPDQQRAFLGNPAGVRAGEVNTGLFDNVIRAANSVYEPIFRQYGLRLILRGVWEEQEANAFAYPGADPIALFKKKAQAGATLKDFNMRIRRVDINGELARNPHMTADALLMVICHEIGHHIGGLPSNGGFASNEGQSDYFASMKCMRQVLQTQKNVEIMRRRAIDPFVRQRCFAAWGRDVEQAALCMRSAMAGKQLARVLNSLGGGENDVDFKTPAKEVAAVTDNRHPEPQCRLDTYFEGALCRVSHNEIMNFRNPLQGACVPERSPGIMGIGLRPACWFHPKLYDRPERVTGVPRGRL
jgi:hypothetical protein